MTEHGKGKLLAGGRYRIEERIGFGGMGAVYRAVDTRIGRVLAIKELRHEYTEDELIRRRFEREAQAAGQLSHRHVVTIYDYFEEGNSLFILMEFLEGGTLLDRMNAAPGRRVDPALAVATARQALEGLEAAHLHGLVHRDVKPGNLLFDREGTVKVADFGVVTAVESEGAITNLTQVGTHPGTLVYMSPEQIDGVEVDGRSDVYSMGAVLYEALCAVRYFERPGMRRTERALMDAICELPPVPLRRHAPHLPQALEDLLSIALRKLPEERPTAQQLADALGALDLSESASGPRIVSPTGPAVRPARRSPGSSGSSPALSSSATHPAISRGPGSGTHPVISRGSGSGSHPTITTGPGSASTRPIVPAREGPGSGSRAALSPLPASGEEETLPRAPATRPGSGRSRPPTERLERSAISHPAPAFHPSERVPVIQVTPPPAQSQQRRRERDGAQEIQIPAGTFRMGGADSSDEGPAREVALSAFALDLLPVTVGQYRAFLAAVQAEGAPELPLLQSLYPRGKDHRPQGWGSAEFDALCPSEEHPVVLVDWFDACAYAAWAGARLPSEAEWERAARGPEGQRRFPWGEEPPSEQRALFGRRSRGPMPAGRLIQGSSAEGVLDLAGNVWEWCADRYDPDSYALLPARDPRLPVEGPRSRAVKRGGSWTNAAHSLRCAKRGSEKLHVRRDNLGFRCAR